MDELNINESISVQCVLIRQKTVMNQDSYVFFMK